MRALDEANRLRLARAAIKRELWRNEIAVQEVLESPPEIVWGMRVGELFRAQKRWGATRTRQFLVTCVIPEEKKIGQLTARQVKVMVGELRRRALRSS